MKYNLDKRKLLYLICILFFTLPVAIFGIKDLEAYNTGYFSNIIYNTPFYNPFIFYTDLIGPGVNFPIGNFPYFHPISIIFASNLRLFFFFSVIINLIIQINYFNKLLKLLRVKKEYYYLSFFIIFSISNYNFVWSDDWVDNFYTYTFFFPGIYYFLKVIKKKNELSFLQFTLIFSFSLINSHPGHYIYFIILIVLLFLFNKKFELLKNKFLYLSFFLFLAICGEYLFNLFNEYFKFGYDIKRTVQYAYEIKHYLASNFLPLNFSSWFKLNRYPGYGIIIIIACIKAVDLIIKRKSKKYYYLDFVYFIFIFLSLSDFSRKFSVFSGVWQMRDMVGILGFILFILFIQDLKNYNIKRIIIFFSIFISILFYFKNFYVYIPYQQNTNNFINRNDTKNNLINFFEEYKKNNSNLSRVYFSPQFFGDLRKGLFKKYNLLNGRDLISYNLLPFQGDFKGVSLDRVQKSSAKMRGWLFPDFEELNSELFLSIFNIKNIIIYKNEFNKIVNKNEFNILEEISLENEKIILFLSRKNFHKKVIISKSDLDKIKCSKSNLIHCLKQNNYFFKFDENIKIIRLGRNKYKIYNKSNNHKFLVGPFLYNNNWEVSEIDSKFNLDNKLLVIKVISETEIIYKNKLRFILKITSLIFFLLLIVIIFRKKQLKNF